MTTETITQERLKQLLWLDENTGLFYWRMPTSNCVKAGELCRSREMRGYNRIQLDNYRYKAHRLVWLYVHGFIPVDKIDHMNGNVRDNRPTNLRICSQGENCRNRRINSNSKSGYKGVHYRTREKAWYASIVVDGRKLEFGRFSTPEAAADKIRAVREELHGEFTRHA